MGRVKKRMKTPDSETHFCHTGQIPGQQPFSTPSKRGGGCSGNPFWPIQKIMVGRAEDEPLLLEAVLTETPPPHTTKKKKRHKKETTNESAVNTDERMEMTTSGASKKGKLAPMKDPRNLFKIYTPPTRKRKHFLNRIHQKYFYPKPGQPQSLPTSSPSPSLQSILLLLIEKAEKDQKLLNPRSRVRSAYG